MTDTTETEPCHINKIPTEVLNAIFQILKDEGPEYLTPCLAVSRSWHSFSRQILWNSLALTEADYDPFAYGLAFGGTSYHALRNLTILFSNAFMMACDCPDWCDKKDYLHHDWGYVQCGSHIISHPSMGSSQTEAKKKLERMLSSLGHVIAAGLRSLLSFSLRILNEPADSDVCICYECVIAPQYFAQIVLALPPTCLQLELDTQNAEIGTGECGEAIWVDQGGCICEALHSIMPQLQDVRLRVACICPEFFYGPHKNLKTSLQSSPFALWAELSQDTENPRAHTETVGSRGDYEGPTGDLINWTLWSAISEQEQLVSEITMKCVVMLKFLRSGNAFTNVAWSIVQHRFLRPPC
jgi:hypothetical protein